MVGQACSCFVLGVSFGGRKLPEAEAEAAG
jgi:hypothetical protein